MATYHQESLTVFGLRGTATGVTSKVRAAICGAALFGATLMVAVEAPAQGLNLFTRVSQTMDVIYVGGHSVCIESFEPCSRACGPRPSLVLMHGADGLATSGKDYREAAQGLAKAGYNAYIVHYFSATPSVAAQGYILPQQIRPQHLAAWLATASAAVQWAASQPDNDPQRVGIIGFSLGAFIGIAEAARNPNIAVMVELFGGIPPTMNPRQLAKMPPTLIIHGSTDDVVPVSEAYRLDAALQQFGVQHETVIYPCMGHNLSGQVRDDAAKRVLEFLGCHL